MKICYKNSKKYSRYHDFFCGLCAYFLHPRKTCHIITPLLTGTSFLRIGTSFLPGDAYGTGVDKRKRSRVIYDSLCQLISFKVFSVDTVGRKGFLNCGIVPENNSKFLKKKLVFNLWIRTATFFHSCPLS